jgi:hypothetical protein
MRQTPLLEFESSAFPVIPGEDEETNPRIYGKALARWLAEQLRAAGFCPGEVIAEDFGWCVPVNSEPHSLHVACASTGERPKEISFLAAMSPVSSVEVTGQSLVSSSHSGSSGRHGNGIALNRAPHLAESTIDPHACL